MEILQKLNLIELFNTILPAGSGELLVLLSFWGFWGMMVYLVGLHVLTREQLRVNTRARITMESIGVVIFPDGGSKEVIIPRHAKKYTVKMQGGNHTWIITEDGWQPKNNGVRYTILHPEIPHNVSINQLAQFYKGWEQEVMNEKGESIGRVPYRPLIRSARAVDSDIYKLAAAETESLLDPNKRLYNAAIAISLILAVCGGIAMLFLLMPTQTTQAATTTATTLAKKVITTTTTTLPNVSGIR